MRLDFFSLHLFADVVDTQSINRGARQNHIAVSAASKRITDLEDLFQTKLLHRHARGVRPTDAGEMLHRRVKATMGDLELLMVEMSQFAQGVRGRVRLHSSSAAAVQRLPGDLASFVEMHPQVQVDLTSHAPADTLDMLVRGEADVGIVAPVASYPESLCVWHYDTVTHVIVTHPSHPLARRESVGFADTLVHDHVSLTANGEWDILLGRMAQRRGGALNVRMRADNYEAVCRLVAANLGLAVVPADSARLYAQPLRLRVLALDEAWASMPVHVCCRDLQSLPASARRLVQHLTARKPEPAPESMHWWNSRSGFDDGPLLPRNRLQGPAALAGAAISC